MREIPKPESSMDGLKVGAVVGLAGVLAVGIPYGMEYATSEIRNAATQTICEVLRDNGVFPDAPLDTAAKNLLNSDDVESVAYACRRKGNIELERSQIAVAVLRAAAEEKTVKPSLLADSAAESIGVLEKMRHCTGCFQAIEIFGLARNGQPVPRELLNELLEELPAEEAEKTDLH